MPAGKKWSRQVTEDSDALDLGKGVFAMVGAADLIAARAIDRKNDEVA